MEQQQEELDYEEDMYEPSEQRLVRQGASPDNSRTECDICYKKFTNPKEPCTTGTSPLVCGTKLCLLDLRHPRAQIPRQTH